MLSSLAAMAQSREVTGVVTDDSNQPLPGVAVVVPGTTIGTVTDFDGKYSINVDDAKQLSFSFIGFETQTLDIVGNSVNAQMVSDAKELDDVVVVGYGVQKKKLVTGATVEVKGDDIQKMSTTQVLGALQSQTPASPSSPTPASRATASRSPSAAPALTAARTLSMSSTVSRAAISTISTLPTSSASTCLRMPPRAPSTAPPPPTALSS